MGGILCETTRRDRHGSRGHSGEETLTNQRVPEEVLNIFKMVLGVFEDILGNSRLPKVVPMVLDG